MFDFRMWDASILVKCSELELKTILRYHNMVAVGVHEDLITRLVKYRDEHITNRKCPWSRNALEAKKIVELKGMLHELKL